MHCFQITVAIFATSQIQEPRTATMDHDALRLFLHLARTLRFLQTSRECHISPSALSRAIQRLEREVGCRLFERDRRTVRLTPEGVRFVEHAREAVDRWEAVTRELRGRAGALEGTITIFASVTACQSFLPGTLSGFRQRFPDIHIRLDDCPLLLEGIGQNERGRRIVSATNGVNASHDVVEPFSPTVRFVVILDCIRMRLAKDAISHHPYYPVGGSQEHEGEVDEAAVTGTFARAARQQRLNTIGGRWMVLRCRLGAGQVRLVELPQDFVNG